ncbi:serine protease easter-like [Culicoides brevitarsis]|uniref:serine protease easter-like n=1 Tax=Culicoides brevitarsis TaxID=469753 RepID=UPI00307C6C34
MTKTLLCTIQGLLVICVPILIAAQSFSFDPRAVHNTSCDHQFGFPGRCIVLNDCPYANGIFKYLEQVRNTGQILEREVLDSYHDYLRKSHCGWKRKHPMVCCDPLPRIDSCFVHVQRIDVSNRISDGVEAGISEFPHMALLINEKVRGRPAFYCGGALINERYVVTAAHCFFEPHKYDRVFIRLGEHDLTSDIDCRRDLTNRTDCTDHVVDVNIEEKIIHEYYEPINFHNDIALIRLATPVNYTRFIQPICLLDPRPEIANLTNQKLEVSGFGKVGPAGNFSNVKLKVSVDAVSQEYCKAKYNTLKSRKIINDDQFCAGGQGIKDTCHGDSGSPVIGRYIVPYQDEKNRRMMIEYKYLVGIVSYGLGKCGTPTWPGVYTRVSNYVDWIRKMMRP